MQIVVAGQGYAGLPLAVRAAEGGHRVVGYDVNAHRVRQLAAGQSYVEDVASDRLRAVLDSGVHSAAADAAALAGFDIAVITVPTPLRDGVPDLTYIKTCARTLGGHLRPGATVVLESTTYPGTTEELLLPILEEASGLKAGEDFQAGFSPERIAPGNKRFSFEETPKVVSGIDAKSLDVIKAFYDGVFRTTVPVSGPKVAELAKLLENTFRLVNISMVNELATLTERLDVNIWEAIDAAATKPFGFTRFTPGPGVGGHCLRPGAFRAGSAVAGATTGAATPHRRGPDRLPQGRGTARTHLSVTTAFSVTPASAPHSHRAGSTQCCGLYKSWTRRPPST
ncbi:nucleotide sugar dehydrogenase [Streptomyces sp. AM 4-1-1]|uniref:nucleotide sugar dehydrogenase n=1 Tax=Streptomyces sp. AM 4-1-1 TaxID=3028710 RepID=UPI0023B9D4E8|nr:nucleotide sugar dehydrogenase [Streptomyces sp. AM 4-1-1]WEH35511.1 nucleotide sugar dehydrogenase [Streptomyces sp. AM 4-1-1]